VSAIFGGGSAGCSRRVLPARRAVWNVMKKTRIRFSLLFLFLAVFLSLALRYLVVPADKLYEKEFRIPPRQSSLVFDVPYRCACVIKIVVPAEKISEVINSFEAFINGDVVRLTDVCKQDGSGKLSFLLNAQEIRLTGNELTVSPSDKMVKVSVSNNKKIYARYGSFYIGDFHLFFDSHDDPTGYDLPRALCWGVMAALVWILVTAFIVKTFWCDPRGTCIMQFVVLAGLFVLVAAQRIALYRFGYPFLIGGKCALMCGLSLFCALQAGTIFLFGYARFVQLLRALRKTLQEYDARYRLSIKLVWCFAVVYVGVFFSLQTVRHLGFFPSMDLNGIVQLVYNAMQGRIWETQYGDFQVGTYLRFHLQPVDLLFVPLYFLVRSNLVFYFVQTVVIAVGALPVYLIASEKLRSNWLGVLFSLLYLLYPSVQNCTMYGFHFEELTIGVFLFAFYALERHKQVLFVLLCLLMMFIKENIAALVCICGVYAFFRGARIAGIAVALLAAAWFYTCIFVIIPHYTPPGAMTYSHSFFSGLGTNAGEVAKTVCMNVFVYARSLYADQFKWNFLLHLFAPLAFLPILAPDILIIASPIFAQLLLSNYVRFHDITTSYQSSVLPCMIIAAIFGFRRLLALKDCLLRVLHIPTSPAHSFVLGGVVLLCASTYCVKNIIPPSTPPYFVSGVYSISPRDVFIKKYLDRISPESSVAVPMVLNEYLAGRRYVCSLNPETIRKFVPDIVVVNSHVCWPAYAEYKYNQQLLKDLADSERYQPCLEAKGYHIFERKDAPYKTGIAVYDHLGFERIVSKQPDGYGYRRGIPINADGLYDMRVQIGSVLIKQTTEQGGYDSFECLPGFKDLEFIAQRFMPPSGRVDAVDIYARRIGNPLLWLSIREDRNGKPADRDIIRISARKAGGVLFKYDWLRFNTGPLELDPQRPYWLILSAVGDGHKNRYDIASFSEGIKGDAYAGKVFYQYGNDPGEWHAPYVRNHQHEDEEGNDIAGIMYRVITRIPVNEKISIAIDGRAIAPKVSSIKKSPHDGTFAYECEGVLLVKGLREVSVSSRDDFQLESVEFVRNEKDVICSPKSR